MGTQLSFGGEEYSGLAAVLVILWQRMWQHSALSTENLQEAKLKSFGLMALAEEISRQPSTDCYVVLVIALKIWFKSVSFHLKDPEKWSFLLQMIQVRKKNP